MQVRDLTIAGAWQFIPVQHPDDRGVFLEGFTSSALEAATGRNLNFAQINVSVSRRGVIRGVHAAHMPPGQAKYVMCLAGEVRDIVVDLRPDSPSFGEWDAVALNDRSRHGVFISEGLGHAFQVISESATVAYATSTPYDPTSEYSVNPLDPDLGIEWEDLGAPVLSPKDLDAPGLRETAAFLLKRQGSSAR